MAQAFRQTRRSALFLGLVVLLFVVAGCGGNQENESEGGDEPVVRGPRVPIVIPAGEPIVVGISTALTGGPVAVRGEEYRDAAVTSIERWKRQHGAQILGHDIEVRAEDDGCTDAYITPDGETRYVAEDAAGDLLRVPGLVGVVGPQCSSGAMAAIPTFTEAGVVAISGSATATGLNEQQPEGLFFFRTAYRNDLEGTLIGLFIGLNPDLNIERAYMIDDGETYGEDLASNAVRVAARYGLTAQRESIVRGTVDFGDLAGRIVEAGADFVGFAGFNPEAALLYRQLRDAGYEGLFGAGDGAASVVEFVEPVGAEAAEGVLFAGCTYPPAQDFLNDFIDVHGEEPVAAFPAQYADAATVLLDTVAAVAEAQDDGSLVIEPTALRDAVRATVLENGLSGAISFDEYGDRIPPGVEDLEQFVDTALENLDATAYEDLGLVACQVQDGKLVNVTGPNAGEIRFP
jgi:branched-chain amino acid transport system substrate-binding protein